MERERERAVTTPHRAYLLTSTVVLPNPTHVLMISCRLTFWLALGDQLSGSRKDNNMPRSFLITRAAAAAAAAADTFAAEEATDDGGGDALGTMGHGLERKKRRRRKDYLVRREEGGGGGDGSRGEKKEEEGVYTNTSLHTKVSLAEHLPDVLKSTKRSLLSNCRRRGRERRSIVADE